jgi:hypothetical protein
MPYAEGDKKGVATLPVHLSEAEPPKMPLMKKLIS